MYFTLSFGYIFSSICQCWGYVQELNACLGFLDETGFSVSSRIFSLQNISILVCDEDGEMFEAVAEIVLLKVKEKRAYGSIHTGTFGLL